MKTTEYAMWYDQQNPVPKEYTSCKYNFTVVEYREISHARENWRHIKMTEINLANSKSALGLKTSPLECVVGQNGTNYG